MSELERHYLLFCARLQRVGVVRAAGETADEFGTRAARALRREVDEIERISALYNELAYGSAAHGAADQHPGGRIQAPGAAISPRAQLNTLQAVGRVNPSGAAAHSRGCRRCAGAKNTMLTTAGGETR